MNERCTKPLVLLFFLALAATAFSAEKAIWKIGTFDYSSIEFHSHDVDYANPKSDLVFIVGQNHDTDWIRFQPGPANGLTGGRLHPFTVKFSLQDQPQGVYHLRIAMLYETPRLSFLKLSVNGHAGFFYFHPKLDFNAGDWEGTFVPQTSTDEKTIAIPAAWLRHGDNEFVFTAMDDPATPKNALGAIAPGHTGIVYDALELTQDESATYDSRAFSALIEPTIFYRKSGNGLTEVVDVFVSAGRFVNKGPVQLNIAGQSFRKTVSSGTVFGELKLTFDVPEWSGTTNATVRMGNLKAAPVKAAMAKKWNVAIIPHEHLDIGFTDYAAKVAELHSQSIDEAIELIKKTPDFKWTLDGSWVADQYIKGRSGDLVKNFLDQVRKGSIAIPPEFANEHTGNASWESLARSFYGYRNLARKYDLPLADAAQIVDVPSYTWGYASILHDAGIKYFVAASNSWRAPIMLHGKWNTKSPFWWEGPDGGRVLMWYSRAYLQQHTLFGGPWQMDSIRDSLPVYLQAYTRPDYTSDTALIFGTQLENTPLDKQQSQIVSAFNREYAWPRLQFGTVQTAMKQIEQSWKGEFPVVRGDFGPYWEDGYGSDARHTAIHRENQHRMSTAEIMGSAVRSLDSRIHPDDSLLADAWWNELLYDEHTWTYVSATTQPEHHQSEDQIALKGARTTHARNNISESIQREWAQLEALVKPKDGSIAVFNSLNWKRSGFVETDVPDGSAVFDSTTGAEVPTEVLRKGKGISLPGFGPGSVRIRFFAADVPQIGYKLFSVKPAPRPKTPETIEGNTFENKFYRVTIDPARGAISSIFDKELNREIVDSSSPYKFGEYLYVSGGDEYPNNSLYRFGISLKPPSLTVNQTQGGKLTNAKRTPTGIVAGFTSTSVNTPEIRTEILLPDAEKQILLTYHVRKDRVLTRESAYIAFPFSVPSPEFAYGSQTAWVDPAKNELAGGSREWYLPTTWASVHGTQMAATVVPLDAPLVSFGDIVRGTWPTDFKPKTSGVFSWLMNNYWGTNFPAWQGGEFTFRYAITSSAQFDPPALTRFALNHLSPLERDDVQASTNASRLPVQQASLLEVSNPDITLLTWKAAEDGDGTILRLQETAGKAAEVSVRSAYLQFEKAWQCNLLEDNQSEIQTGGDSLKVTIKPFQVLTLRIRTSANLSSGEAK